MHAPVAVPSVVHAVLPRIGQLLVPQPPDAHVTSHAQASLHSTSLHAASPLQSTTHRPLPLLPHAIVPAHAPGALHSTSQLALPQWMSLHAPVALHAIVHDAALPQWSVSHAPGLLHVMSQCRPSGQVKSEPPVTSARQVGGEVERSQPWLQTSGQSPPAVTTQ